MPGKDNLEEYRRKRDFRRTSEPHGGHGRRTRGEPRFTVHKHGARSLHYDFRLEDAGVLKSWAVPKGPPSDPAEKAFATPTEDHPLDYADFEGVIPDDQYGAGPVELWDTGTYRNLTADHGHPVPVADGISRGHIAVWLKGRKLRGGYALTRMRRRGRQEGWLLVKMRDEAASPRRDLRKTEPQSVHSGRTLEQIAASG